MNPAATDQTPAANTSSQPGDVKRLDLFVDADGKHWHVHLTTKNTVVLRGSGKIEGMEKRIPRAELAAYQKAKIPATIEKGQTLFCDGVRCVVNGFRKPLFALLLGAWGGEDGSEQDAAFPMSREHFAIYGVRLPFPGEVDADVSALQHV